MNHQAHIHWHDETLILQVYVQARASRDEISGWHEHGLKIRLQSPPVDGQANKHLIRFLAKQFKVAISKVSLLKGDSSRQKTLAIEKPTTIPDWLTTNRR